MSKTYDKDWKLTTILNVLNYQSLKFVETTQNHKLIQLKRRTTKMITSVAL